MPLKTNYHTHHELCKHAEGTAGDYVRQAIELNMETLGFSDHAPSHVLDQSFRMSFDELDAYLADCMRQKETYKDTITIHIGLECEYLDKNPLYYQNLLKKVDYMILGQHMIVSENSEKLKSSYALDTIRDIRTYVSSCIEAFKTGYFSMIAHPDLCLFGHPNFSDTVKKEMRRLIEASIQHDVYLEYNANGIRKGKKHYTEGERYSYPREEFWALVKEYKDAKVIVSADAHAPKQLFDAAIIESYEHLNALGIKAHNALPFKNLYKE